MIAVPPPVEGYCSVDGTLVRPTAAVGYCSVDGILISVLVVGYCSEDGTLVRVASYRSPDETLLSTAPGGAYFSSDATRTSTPDDGGGGYGCSVDGTRFKLTAAAVVVAYCSAEGTRVILEYCSTEMVLVRVPAVPLALDAIACCSVDGILVRVPRLLAEQLVVIIEEVPLKATDRRFGL